MTITPRRTPPNPFAKPDLAAETAICSAFVVLDFRGETPCLTAVGRIAKQMLLQQFGPDLTPVAALDRIRAALVALYERNAFDLPQDTLKACLLHGEDLHPDLRAHLGLPLLPHLRPRFRPRCRRGNSRSLRSAERRLS